MMPLLHELSPPNTVFLCKKYSGNLCNPNLAKSATPLYWYRKAMEIIIQALGIHKGTQIYKTIFGNKFEIYLLKEAFVI